MVISPIKISDYKNRCTPVYVRRQLVQKHGDVVNFSGGQAKCFKKLTSKTLNELYDTHFIPSGIDYGEHFYPTFVFDRLTGKPVEVVVTPYRIDEMSEEYHIINPNNMCRIARRVFSYDDTQPYIISAGSMESKFERYLGLGIRLHQIAIERMKMKNFKNVEIYSTAEAYPFHKKLGFEPFKEIKVYDKKSFERFVKESALSLDMDEESVKKLMDYKIEFDEILLNVNSTNGNFIDYMHSNLSKFNEGILPYCAYMRLSSAALAEWTMFAEKNPIFLDKKLPIFYQTDKNFYINGF